MLRAPLLIIVTAFLERAHPFLIILERHCTPVAKAPQQAYTVAVCLCLCVCVSFAFRVCCVTLGNANVQGCSDGRMFRKSGPVSPSNDFKYASGHMR